MKRLYTNGPTKVYVTARMDASVELSVTDGRGDWSWIIGTNEPRRWWDPRTWRNITPEEAARRAIALADEAARKHAQAQFNLQRAERTVADLESRTTALRQLNEEYPT